MKEHPFAIIKDSKIFRKGFCDFPDREIGEVRDDAESSVQYFENRFSIIEQKVAQLENKIQESDNKGSYLMKLIHLKEYLTGFDGIGDFEDLYKRLDQKEKYLQEIILQNRIKNYEIKKALLEELENLKGHFNLPEAGDKIREIKFNWIKTGAVLEEHREEIEKRFNACLDHFTERLEAYYVDRKLVMEDTVERYRNLVKQAEDLYKVRDIKESTRRLKELQNEWKNLGSIPSEPYIELKTKFQKINDDIFAQLRAIKEEEQHHRQRRLQRVIDHKKKLLEELNDRIRRNADDLERLKREFLDRWKKLGNHFNKEIHILNDTFFARILFINEKLFVEKLASRKYSNFDMLDPDRKNRIKIKILSELIERDENDLSKYNKNMEVFSIRPGSVDQIFNNKRNEKQKSLLVKKELLESLKNINAK